MEIYAGEKAVALYGNNTWLPEETVEAIKEFSVAIKGPLTTPIGGGIRSLNVALRQLLAKYILAMKKKLFQVLLVLSIIGTSLAGAFMEYFHARAEGENVKLEWKTGEESNLKNFVIERKTQQSSYVDLSTITPKGNNSFYILH